MARGGSSHVSINVVAFNRIPKVVHALTNDANIIVQKTATDLQSEIVTSLEGQRSGRQYGTHTASAPGEKPARWYGQLANSIGIRRGYREAVVYASAAHGPHLEFGTRHMGKRPFMKPAARKLQAVFVFAMTAMVKKATGAR